MPQFCTLVKSLDLHGFIGHNSHNFLISRILEYAYLFDIVPEPQIFMKLLFSTGHFTPELRFV